MIIMNLNKWTKFIILYCLLTLLIHGFPAHFKYFALKKELSCDYENSIWFVSNAWVKKIISGVSIHDRGFGFVQFEKEEDARKAQEAENGTKFLGQVLGRSSKFICILVKNWGKITIHFHHSRPSLLSVSDMLKYV